MNTATIWEAGESSVPAFTANFAAEQVFVVDLQGKQAFDITNFTYVTGANALKVYVNGVRQVLGTDFFETSTSSFSLNVGIDVGDTVLCEAYSISGEGIPVATEVTPVLVQNNTYTSATTTTGAGTGDSFILNLVPALPAYLQGQVFQVTFHTGNVAGATLTVNSLAALLLVEEDSAGTEINLTPGRITAGKTYIVICTGTAFKVLGLPAIMPAQASVFNYLSGGLASRVGSTLTLQACQASSNNNVLMTIPIAWSKVAANGSAAWTPGNGGGAFSGGSTLPVNTDLFVYMIYRTDTGTSDYVIDTNGTTPTLTGPLSAYSQFRKLPIILRFNLNAFTFVLNRPTVSSGQPELIGKYSFTAVPASSIDQHVPNIYGDIIISVRKLRSVSAVAFLALRLQNNGTALAAASDHILFYDSNIGGVLANPGVSTLTFAHLGLNMGNSVTFDNQIDSQLSDIYDTSREISITSTHVGVENTGPTRLRARIASNYIGAGSGLTAARNGIRLFSSDAAFFNRGEVLIWGVPK